MDGLTTLNHTGETTIDPSQRIPIISAHPDPKADTGNFTGSIEFPIVIPCYFSKFILHTDAF